MDTDIKNVVRASDKEAQYDEKAKRLLGNKYVLAYILINTVDEFEGMLPEEVVPCIEGEVIVGAVPVEPGLTNAANQDSGMRIVGFNSENAEINEGLIRFDIVFYVRMKDGLSQMIINVEAQKYEPAEYDILNRAIFYASRLISSQKERDFTNTNYNNIKRVFSIWICMNMSENNLDHVHLIDDKLLGKYRWKGKLNLLNIILIGLSNNLTEQNREAELYRLLGTLLSRNLSADEKLSIIESEYSIPIEESIKEAVNVMCNLSQGIREEGRYEGLREGRYEGIKEGRYEGILDSIRNLMESMGWSSEQAMKALKIPEAEQMDYAKMLD